MKRKSQARKSKSKEETTSNGVSNENGEAAERSEENELEEVNNKRRKGGKSRSTGKKPKDKEDLDEEIADEADDQEDEEPAGKRRKSSKGKALPKKVSKDKEGEEEAQYEVEKILEEKYINRVRHYLIRWKGYEPESDTWEPESTLNCAELIEEYKSKQKKSGKAKKKIKGGRVASKPDETWDENEKFEVERILDVYFKRNGQREFLVLWKGYPQSMSSWEPEENMDCKDLIERFMVKVEKAKGAEQRELRVKRTHTDRLTLLSDGHLGRRLSKRNLGKQRVHYHEDE